MTRTPASSPTLDSLAVGDVVVERSFVLDRGSMVRYAGASGDFNPIHYNDEFARSVGLDGVIAHGMLTMGTAISAVTEWTGDPAAVIEYGTRFTRPVPVPALGEATIAVTAKVGAIDADAGTARIDLAVTLDGQAVLGRARATVRLPASAEHAA